MAMMRQMQATQMEQRAKPVESPLPPMAYRIVCRTCKGVLGAGQAGGNVGVGFNIGAAIYRHLADHLKEDGTAVMGVDVEAMVTW
jgi:hypothetical protein